MANPFVAEIRIVGFNFPPIGWAFCNGQIMPISQNTALFSLLGTTYGGDGRSTFGLPNLQGIAPMQQGQGPGLSLRTLGETGGEQTVTLLQSQIPAHNHFAMAAAPLGEASPNAHTWGSSVKGHEVMLYAPPPANTTMNPNALAPAGNSLPHDNMPPYLTLNFIIALQGVYPPRS
jgi:microcystin-dependent protein